MSALLRGIVATAAILAISPPIETDAFNAGGRHFTATSSVTRRMGRAVSSPLFTGSRDRRRTAAPFRGGEASLPPSRSSLVPLLMTEGDAGNSTDTDSDVGEAADAVVEESSSDSSSGGSAVGKREEDNRSGFVTALLLGPPLILKFVIVLVVKFLTDLVVFPLLFLYRLASRGKRKVLSVFGKGGDSVNGDGTADGDF